MRLRGLYLCVGIKEDIVHSALSSSMCESILYIPVTSLVVN